MINLSMSSEMLLSIVNTKLRNHTQSLDELCKDHQLDKTKLEEKLKAIGYIYDASKNAFVFKNHD